MPVDFCPVIPHKYTLILLTVWVITVHIKAITAENVPVNARPHATLLPSMGTCSLDI